MGAASMLTLLLTNPNEFRTLTQFWLWHQSKRDITAMVEHPTSGWDRPSMRKCWDFLDLTSRSFSAVIKELEGDLARTICLFYLVLRGLDTVEDDMTISDETKQPLLRSFYKKITTPGFNFDGCGPKEKDRQLLVEFDTVVTEVNLLEPAYRDVIVDICHKMGVGMADFAHKAYVDGTLGLDTIVDFDLYCHYVAGLVGEGLSRIFSASKKEAEWLGDQLELSNSMGLMLQKTNILRDVREDIDDGRLFWPKEIYVAHGFVDPVDMTKKENVERAMWALSEMTLDTLRHASDALEYLSLLRNQSVFNFCAIPQTMAMATLALCFMNPDVFQRNVKIRKAQAAKLIMSSTNPRDVAFLFRDYARVIHNKAKPHDPNFLRISVACGKIEQWCEHRYPSFVKVVTSGEGQPTYSLDPNDARTKIVELEKQKARERVNEKRANGSGNGLAAIENQNNDVFFYTASAFGLVLAMAMLIGWGVIQFAT